LRLLQPRFLLVLLLHQARLLLLGLLALQLGLLPCKHRLLLRLGKQPWLLQLLQLLLLLLLLRAAFGNALLLLRQRGSRLLLGLLLLRVELLLGFWLHLWIGVGVRLWLGVLPRRPLRHTKYWLQSWAWLGRWTKWLSPGLDLGLLLLLEWGEKGLGWLLQHGLEQGLLRHHWWRGVGVIVVGRLNVAEETVIDAQKPR